VRATGGLYVALVHAGVFGPDDAARREAHLDFVAGQLRHPETWLTTPQRLVEWWCGRESLRLTAADGAVRVVNAGDRSVAGAVLVVERAESTDTVTLPVLTPGGAVTVVGGTVVETPGDGAHAA
jgi:hypothetical protein